MLNDRLTVLLQLDALRHDYLCEINTPFFSHGNAGNISGSLIPTFGFEPDAAYIAGLYPDESDGGAQFWYDPEKSPFRFLKTWSRIGNLLPDLPDRAMRRFIKGYLKRTCPSPVLSTARVPFNLLKYFDFPMKDRMDASLFVKSESLFDILRSNGRTWLYHGSPDNRVDIQSVVQRAKQDLYSPINFAFFHVGDLDKTGHQYGPDSPQRRSAMKKVIKGVEDIYHTAGERFSQVHLVLMGDHGMMEVQRHLDIWSELRKLPIRLEKDYIVFLDSTMARFWFFSDKAERLIIDLLDNIKGGHVVSQEENDRYHLNYAHNKFGDVIFLADPGVLIFPNFYQNKKPVKGMHGYAPETPDQQSALLIHSPKVKEPVSFEEPVDMRRIFPTLLDLLGLPVPEGIRIRSLIE